MKVIQAIIQPFGCLLVLVTTLAAASHGQQRSASSYQVPQNTSIQVDVNLTLVGVTVTNRRGEYVRGLSAENFKLLEDKVEQKIEYFSAEDIPVSIGLILDISGSMKSAASVAHDATVAFLKEGNRDDEYFLVEFNERPMVAEDFTTDTRRLEDRIKGVAATGPTALYDAVHIALDKLRQGTRPRKAILLISDGEDNDSRYSFRTIEEFAREQDAAIYAIGILPEKESPSRMLHRSGREVLEGLTSVTPGRAFFTSSTRNLEMICRQIAQEIRSQYLLGYRSTNTLRDGQWRKISVRMIPPHGASRITVRARPGYYAAAR